MKIYVAGPMRGYPDSNFPAFDEAEAFLLAEGHDVRSPAKHDREVGFDLEASFRWDIDSVLWADRVVLLPGWRNSAGAGIEVAVAQAVGTPCQEWHPGGLVRDLSNSPALEAHDIVNGPRRASYGHPMAQFARVARLWEAILELAPDTIPPRKIGLCMVAFKISREMNAHHRDNLVDIAGYAETLHHAHREES